MLRPPHNPFTSLKTIIIASNVGLISAYNNRCKKCGDLLYCKCLK